MDKMLEILNRIEENTKKTEQNTSSKDSFYILVNGRTTDIRTRFNPLIQLDKSKKWEMALVSLETYHSFPNIKTGENDNFRYSVDNGTTWVNINIPIGSYELEAVNQYIQRIMKANNHYDAVNDKYYISITANNNTLNSILEITNPSYRVDFTPVNSIRTVLGFNAQIYSNGTHESENIVNILNVSSLRVTSDLITSSYINGGTENIIYSFFPEVSPGYKIVKEPHNLIYLPLSLNTIAQTETKLVDQNGKLIDLRGEELSIRFHIRQA